MKKYAIIGLLVFSTILSSCDVNLHSFSAYKNYIEVKDDYQYVKGNNYYKPSSYSISFSDVYRSFPHDADRQVNFPSFGEQNLLVVPIQLKDYSCSTLKLGCNDTITQIQNVFFGKEKNNEWESVASFYNKSSFGKLILKGEVTSWYQSEVSSIDILNDSNGKTLANLLINATNWAKGQIEDIAKYDKDKDGFIDGVSFVYSAPSKVNTKLWAFRSSLNTKKDLDNPSLKSFIWISQDFLSLRKFYSKPQARTFIHEIGHLFGLDDYYPVDSNQIYFPLGKLDMMDLGIGDHNAFSKMLLDWTRPYVVEGDTNISIKPSYENGDCILVKSNWNGSVMDEYILIEYYYPKGLNKHDSEAKFISNGDKFSLMDKPGIKIYHVDARYAYYKTFANDDTFIGYESQETQEILKYYDENNQLYYRKIAHTNTLETTKNGNMLISIIEPNGGHSIKSGGTMNNNLLFKTNDVLSNFTFNDGSKMGYEVRIEDINEKEALISFSKII